MVEVGMQEDRTDGDLGGGERWRWRRLCGLRRRGMMGWMSDVGEGEEEDVRAESDKRSER